MPRLEIARNLPDELATNLAAARRKTLPSHRMLKNTPCCPTNVLLCASGAEDLTMTFIIHPPGPQAVYLLFMADRGAVAIAAIAELNSELARQASRCHDQLSLRRIHKSCPVEDSLAISY